MRTALACAVLAAASLQGCGAIDTRWDECDKGAPTFVSMADCTSRTVQEDAARPSNPAQRARSQARAQRFSQISEELSEKVATGRIAEAEARLIYRRVLEDLLDAERDDRLAPIRQQPKTMTCSPTGAGGGVICSPN